jgi:hypothetical protein
MSNKSRIKESWLFERILASLELAPVEKAAIIMLGVQQCAVSKVFLFYIMIGRRKREFPFCREEFPPCQILKRTHPNIQDRPTSKGDKFH